MHCKMAAVGIYHVLLSRNYLYIYALHISLIILSLKIQQYWIILNLTSSAYMNRHISQIISSDYVNRSGFKLMGVEGSTPTSTFQPHGYYLSLNMDPDWYHYLVAPSPHFWQFEPWDRYWIWHHQIMWTDHDIIRLCEQKTCRCSVNTIDTYQSRFDRVDFGRAVLEADLSTLDSFRREFYENMDWSKKFKKISTRII